ncbi:MAG: hypothetical protein ACRDLD_02400 [Thermoleophilaceae bacterium]
MRIQDLHRMLSVAPPRGRHPAADRLAKARRCAALARDDFALWPNDLSYERVRRTELELEDAVAVAQEFCIQDAPGAEAWR